MKERTISLVWLDDEQEDAVLEVLVGLVNSSPPFPLSWRRVESMVSHHLQPPPGEGEQRG